MALRVQVWPKEYWYGLKSTGMALRVHVWP